MKGFKNKHWSVRALIAAGLFVSMSLAFTSSKTSLSNTVVNKLAVVKSSFVEAKMPMYDSLGLGSLGLSREAFEYALTGFNNLVNTGKITKDNILSILDFTLPSGKKRFFVIDLAAGELVFNTYAAHGKNSGTTTATKFSNKPNSNQSSLGFYVT